MNSPPAHQLTAGSEIDDAILAARFMERDLSLRLRSLILGTVRLTVLGGSRVLRRLFDVVGSAVLLLILAPLFAVLALAIRWESPGPAVCAQTRVGRQGRLFTLYTLRSLFPGTEARVTRWGRRMRKASIDELPQLWNVLKGDMSLLGPRPPLPSEVAAYSLLDRLRLEITPGMRCLR